MHQEDQVKHLNQDLPYWLRQRCFPQNFRAQVDHTPRAHDFQEEYHRVGARDEVPI